MTYSVMRYLFGDANVSIEALRNVIYENGFGLRVGIGKYENSDLKISFGKIF